MGYVYILTNPSFKDDWIKIGKSSRPVDIRSKELDNTATPLPFEIYATLKTEKYNEVERLIHKTIDRLTDLRIRQSREFFNISPDKALDILKDISMTLDDAEISERKPEVETEVKHSKSSRFNFDMVNIPIGSELIFIPTGLKVIVADFNKIEYQGRLYKLSPFVETFLPEEQQTPSRSYQGSKYFSFNGKVLENIRKEIENGR